MIRSKMKKNYIMILTKKQQKYQDYHLIKIDKYEYITGEKILSSNQRQINNKTR